MPPRTITSPATTPCVRLRAARTVPALLSVVVVACVALSLTYADEPAASFDGARAYRRLEDVCALGPRIPGSPGMERQQQMLVEHFTALGAECSFQEFDAPHPLTGAPVRLKNLIVVWRPESTQRVLLACHYDTRPRPDRELLPRHRDAPFLGANDGASGVAILMELGELLPEMPTRYGVDFVFFDAEELIYNQDRDKYFLGSEHFAREYVRQPPAHRYLAGVLLDMVGDKDLRVFQEVNSLRLARQVTESVWQAAARAGVKEFVPRRKHEVRDDHLPLNEIAGIPTCDVIDFDFPHWHTRNDVPASCSADSLGKVGRVMQEWLTHLPEFPPPAPKR